MISPHALVTPGMHSECADCRHCSGETVAAKKNLVDKVEMIVSEIISKIADDSSSAQDPEKTIRIISQSLQEIRALADPPHCHLKPEGSPLQLRLFGDDDTSVTTKLENHPRLIIKAKGRKAFFCRSRQTAKEEIA